MTSLAELPPETAVARAATVALAYRISVDQFEAMERHDIFAPDDKLELIHGLITRKAPIEPPHAFATSELAILLLRLCGDGWAVRCQAPLRLFEDSAPQPDVAVAIGSRRDYATVHPVPSQTALVVEVAETSLALDLGVKLALYAAAKIPEYWVVDLAARRLHIHTLPRGGKKPGYRHTMVLEADAEVPLTLRGEALGSIRVTEFLP